MNLRETFSAEVVAALEELVVERVEATLADRAAVDDVPPLLTLTEAAGYLRVSVRLVQRLIAQGELRVTHLGRRVLLRRVDLDALLERGEEVRPERR
jgi:excisionase family DNA binding protein